MINKRFFKTKDEVEVTFELKDVKADSVAIAADFLGWEATPMKKLAKGTTFKFKTRLPKNEQFEFRYLINEQEWVNDAHADSYIKNSFGEENSLVSTAQ
ncbi:1,4-alpha-glucan branching protein [Vibrio sp. 10N.286.49.B3]|uniref:isoamylase early set domain-containing protein n=1 Tax=Vibrio sp. 10N.286.49.B3 TaxID=1880855 RepID=UPI000C839B24|nr:isoamylase early set domain-containing protein [Vibrio sp. 10N.286.49.B3]PMH43195.1 1,4-alpha-glucan branching protein [Vibrio sp. 10N.286.49.B3]